jgi:(1->4)-alpha-D-glucan 1-alpha-D-glucosylmutase
VLKVGSPGVPDFYQGTELWSLRLTDPDNRALVDLGYRQRLLQDLQRRLARGPGDRPALVAELLDQWQDGIIKMFTTTEALRIRRASPELFTTGAYLPLDVQLDPTAGSGPQVIAFLRRTPTDVALVAVPRFTAGLVDEGRWPIGADVWGDSRLMLPRDCGGLTFTHAFTRADVQVDSEHSVRVAVLLDRFPVALATADIPHGQSGEAPADLVS